MISKKRADLLLFEKGLTKSRSEAGALIMDKKVIANGELVLKAGQLLKEDSEFEIISQSKFVSRGGEKLSHAIDEFKINIQSKVCMDIGSSTGGFTDCLLQNGAKKVYALDVGYGQLDWKLRNDERVVVMEKTNIRNLKSFPEKISIITIDVSFISLKIVLPVIDKLLNNETEIVALIKPQFEVGKDNVEKGGVVKNEKTRLSAINDVKQTGKDLEWNFMGLTSSPIQGAKKGNIEYLIYFKTGIQKTL